MRTRRARWIALGGAVVVAGGATIAAVVLSGSSPGTSNTAATSASGGHGHPRHHRPPRPIQPPPAPANLAATNHRTAAVVTWQEPRVPRSAAASFRITYGPMGGGATRSLTVRHPRVQLRGLLGGRTYRVTVSAANRAGSSAAASLQLVRATVPGPPHLDVSSGSGRLVATWTPPADGGSPISGYLLLVHHHGAKPQAQRLGPATTSAQLDNLAGGSPYSVGVRALNAVGTGRVTWARGAPAGPPGTVIRVAVVPVASGLLVHWQKLTASGSPPDQYQVTATPVGGGTPTTATTTLPRARVEGLTPGTTYQVTVVATNSQGSGPPSAAVQGTPGSRPAAPSGLHLTATRGTVTASWAPPAGTGGLSVRGYRVVLSRQPTRSHHRATARTSVIERTVRDTHVVVSGLEPGQTYRVAVSARTAAGSGPPARGRVHVPS